VSAFKAMLSKYLLFTEMSLLWFLAVCLYFAAGHLLLAFPKKEFHSSLEFRAAGSRPKSHKTFQMPEWKGQVQELAVVAPTVCNYLGSDQVCVLAFIGGKGGQGVKRGPSHGSHTKKLLM